jgi:hypothetical protein
VIHFETLDADQGRVIRDPDTLAEIGIKPSKRGEEEVLEVTYLAPAASTDTARKTVMATIYPTKRPSASFDLAGRLTMRTVTRKALITEQIRQSQRALNFAASMVKRNVETSGFLQDTLLNGELPGHEEGEGENKRWVLDGIERGPLAFNSIRGIPIKDDPADPNRVTGLHDGVDRSPRTRRSHADDQSEAGALRRYSRRLQSEACADLGRRRGVRRVADPGARPITSRSSASRRRRSSVRAVDDRDAVLLANALVLASANADQPNVILDGLRATFSCFLDAGPVDASERAKTWPR